LETERLPPPATCYGALLSLIGEVDRERHRGCRVTAGLLGRPRVSTVLRTLWQIKKGAVPQGTKENAGPDLQQLVVGADVVLWCDGSEETAGGPNLEARILKAMREPDSLQRFGGWSLGESTHLINDAWLLTDATPPSTCSTFLVQEGGDVTLPIWVDHVGSAGTRYAIGRIEEIVHAPQLEQLAQIPFAT
jgi:CRISPR-associated protein Cas5t